MTVTTLDPGHELTSSGTRRFPFDTPQPITVSIEIGAGTVSMVANDRTDTVVEVRPTNPERPGDVTAAAQTRVELTAERLLVRGPRGWRQHLRGGGASVDVHIELPSGSGVEGDAGVAPLRTAGRLGDVRYRTGAGDMNVDEAGRADLRTGAGRVSVSRCIGDAELTSGSGQVDADHVAGRAVLRCANGDAHVGDAGGDLRVTTANGNVAIGRAGATVTVKSARGDIRIGDVGPGAVVARTSFGQIDIGVRAGVAAWLDVSTGFGVVRSDLRAADGPDAGEARLEIRATTAFGDITLHRTEPAA